MFNPDQKAALGAPLDRANVSTRSQSGRHLSYIEGWWAESEANRIFGYEGWDTEEVWSRCVTESPRKIGQAGHDGWGVSYVCKVRVTVRHDGGVVVRDGVGAGHGIDRDQGLAHESAIKEAATDAEKRALKTFGNPFGLALYDKSQANVVDAPKEEKNGNGPAPEGQDFWGCDGSGLSAYQAKKDGLDVTHERMRQEIGALTSATEWRTWCKDNVEAIKPMPKSWRVILRNDAEEMARELGVEMQRR